MSRQKRADAPTKLFNVRLTDAERKRLEEAARTNGQKLGEFARDAIVTAAEDCLESDS